MNHNELNNPPQPIPEYIEPDWVDTPTSANIRTVLMYAQTTPDIALIHGGAGVSKTYTAQRYLQETDRKSRFSSEKSISFVDTRPTVYLVTAHPGMSTVASALYAISEAVGRCGDAYRNDTMARQILQAVNPGDLLMVDEAQNLDIKALDQIRYFHDAGGIGVVYLGNDEIHTRINGRGRKAAFLGPLSSRVGMQLSIPHPTDKDVIAILKAWNVEGEKEVNYAITIGLSSIGLRGLTKMLRQAALIAKGMDRVLDVRAMRTAVTNLRFNN